MAVLLCIRDVEAKEALVDRVGGLAGRHDRGGLAGRRALQLVHLVRRVAVVVRLHNKLREPLVHLWIYLVLHYAETVKPAAAAGTLVSRGCRVSDACRTPGLPDAGGAFARPQALTCMREPRVEERFDGRRKRDGDRDLTLS